MRIISWLILIILIVGSKPAMSELVIVPLPGLQGEYFGPDGITRSTEFFLPAIPTSITAARIAIWGELQPGRAVCYFGYNNLGMRYSVLMVDSTSGGEWRYTLYSGHHGGVFYDRAELEPYNGATWDFLMDGHGYISIQGNPLDADPECTIEELPTSILNSVVLYIEGEFATPVEPTTWSRIKAFYR